MPRGGKRKGSGRKPGKHGTRETVVIRLTLDVREYLATHPSQGEAVDAMVRKTVGFKRWIEQRKDEK